MKVRKKEEKTESLSIRIKPSVKKMAQAMGDRENRSVANFIEEAIVCYYQMRVSADATDEALAMNKNYVKKKTRAKK